jgi:hypothetical protein
MIFGEERTFVEREWNFPWQSCSKEYVQILNERTKHLLAIRTSTIPSTTLVFIVFRELWYLVLKEVERSTSTTRGSWECRDQ